MESPVKPAPDAELPEASGQDEGDLAGPRGCVVEEADGCACVLSERRIPDRYDRWMVSVIQASSGKEVSLPDAVRSGGEIDRLDVSSGVSEGCEERAGAGRWVDEQRVRVRPALEDRVCICFSKRWVCIEAVQVSGAGVCFLPHFFVSLPKPVLPAMSGIGQASMLSWQPEQGKTGTCVIFMTAALPD